ncbi:hypothetical protein D3C81_1985480 [compost metagenome]
MDKPISFLGCFEDLPENTLGQKLVKARLYHGLLVKEAAAILNVDSKTITNWELDKKIPSSAKKPALMKFIELLLK